MGALDAEILNLALEAGDDVTAVVRLKEKLADIDHPKLNVRAGDVCDAEALKQILPEHDVVISTLGPRTPTKAACKIYSDSAAGDSRRDARMRDQSVAGCFYCITFSKQQVHGSCASVHSQTQCSSMRASWKTPYSPPSLNGRLHE
jgi:hypothetical protein